MQCNYVIPWMVCGDFNVVTSHDEKLGGNPINTNDVNEFLDMIYPLV